MEERTDMEDVQLQFGNLRIFPEEHRSVKVRRIIEMFEKHLNYTFVKFLGNGAFGDVVELMKSDGKTSLAMKVILAEQQRPMEVSMWPQFAHKNVQSVIEDITVEPSQARVYVMTRQKGTLSHRLKSNSFLGLPDTLLLIRRWLTDILEGLNYLHKRKVCHLDIKADNVLISYEMTALLSDFSTIQSTEERTSRYGAPVLCCPPETCPSRRFRPPVEGTAFDLWTVGMLALNMLTGSYIERRFTLVRSWIDDVYPLIFEAIEENTFLSLVKTAHLSSYVDKETLRDMRNFVLSFLVLDPDDRPSAQHMLEHAFLKSGSYRFLPDRIWINKASSEQLKALMAMLDEPTGIESVIKVVSGGKNSRQDKEVSEDSCLSTNSSIQLNSIDNDHHEIVGDTTSKGNTDIVSDSQVDKEINDKTTDSFDTKSTHIKDLLAIEINENVENNPCSEEKPDSKEEQHVSQSSGDLSVKSEFIPIVEKSNNKDIEKQLQTKPDAGELFGLELDDKEIVEKVEEHPENDNSGLKRKTLSRRIRGWFRKRWTGVRKCIICGCK